MTYSLITSIGVLYLGLVVLLAVVSSCTSLPEPNPGNASSRSTSTVLTHPREFRALEVVPLYTYEIVNTYPHDPKAFTQGLAFEEDILYEGTGLRGQSTLRKVELETGHILRLRELPPELFGEGVTIYRDKLIQLTLQSHLGFVYHKGSFELLREFNYPAEGWGITYDGRRLIMSDGSSTLRFLDPETLEEIGWIEVHDRNGPVARLNELEYVRGEIYANVWKTDRIARIAPQTGQVVGWINLQGLLSPEELNDRVDALNGIAYDAKNDRLFVTGKFWPKVFEVKLVLSKE